MATGTEKARPQQLFFSHSAVLYIIIHIRGDWVGKRAGIIVSSGYIDASFIG
jgi:hypothetical protein